MRLRRRYDETGAEERVGGAPAEGSRGPAARAGEAPPREPMGAGERRAGAPRRRRLAWRGREAGAAAVGAAGAGVVVLARLVMTVAVLIALLIGLAIVLADVDANARNTIVEGIHEGANFFAGSFTGLISFTGHPKRAITVDWGIALLAYLLVGAIVSRAIFGVGSGGLRFERRHRNSIANY
jgi:hypothetical protein